MATPFTMNVAFDADILAKINPLLTAQKIDFNQVNFYVLTQLLRNVQNTTSPASSDGIQVSTPTGG